MRSHMIGNRNGRKSAIHGAQEKTGVGVAHSGRQTHAVEGRKACFSGAVVEPSVAIGFVEHLITVGHHFAAEFVRVVVAYPGEARVGSRFAINEMDLISGASRVAHAALISKQSRIWSSDHGAEHGKESRIRSRES